MEDRFVARNSLFKITLSSVGSLAFVAAGLWIAGVLGKPPRPDIEWFGWLAVVFFGYAFVVLVSRLLLANTEWLEIDQVGFRYRQHSDAKIPWSAVRSVRSTSVRRQRFISLDLLDRDRFPRTAGTPFARLNSLLGFGDVVLSASGTDRTFDELSEAVHRFAPPAIR